MMCLSLGAPGQTVCSTCLDRRSGFSGTPWSRLTIQCRSSRYSTVQVLRVIDTVVPEQVIDVPKITSQDVIPQRAVLRVPQMAEQLVDEPTPSFDDFELVEEEEEEDEQQQPSLVTESYFRDDFGREWCRVCGREGFYWWMIGTSTVQWPSGGYTARPGRYRNTGRRGDSGG